ncbi:MAG: ABC transporter substrate-binding protein [Lactobacillales bacterium]|jgi:putative ABC transport system substrate-binding protein|nr:ABC transporter substrate-binding protein [Lactobacillales bacterium]
MKNKRVMVIVGVIALFLVGFLGIELGKRQPQAQAPKKETIKTVGVLQFVSHPALDEIYEGIEAGLKEEGYKIGKNLKIEFKNGQADQSKLTTMGQQLVDGKPDAVIGIATLAAQALANATKDIPILLGAITDPVGAGLVKNEEHPGGNITGVSNKSPIKAQLELAKQILPNAKIVGVLYSSSEDNSKSQIEPLEKAGKDLGLTVKPYAVPSTNEISTTVEVMGGAVDFIYLPSDNTIASAMQTVVEQANKTKTPIFPTVDTQVAEGGLATLGINQFDLGVQTGKMTAKILKGESDPATTPIYIFKTGDLIINKKQAEFLGIELPQDILEKGKDVSVK